MRYLNKKYKIIKQFKRIKYKKISLLIKIKIWNKMINR